jgi:3-oxoacyl-[acyl-carrier-protein] synthase II
MVATNSSSYLPDNQRIVLDGNRLDGTQRKLAGRVPRESVERSQRRAEYEIRYVGKTFAGICRFDERRYQARKDLRRGTRAGSVGSIAATRRSAMPGWTGRTSTNRGSGSIWG